MTQDEIATLIEDCENRQSRLTDWERRFIDSLSNQIAAGRPASRKQQAVLDELWERVTAYPCTRD